MITESEITGPVAREMRVQLGMTQKEFWGPAGVSQSVACRYETCDVAIPRSARILLVARHVSGVKIDAATREGVEDLTRLGAIQAKHAQAKAVATSARSDIFKAIKSLETARDALQSL